MPNQSFFRNNGWCVLILVIFFKKLITSFAIKIKTSNIIKKHTNFFSILNTQQFFSIWVLKRHLDFVPKYSMIGVRHDFSRRLSSLFVGSIPDGVVFGFDGEDATLADWHVTHQLDAEIGPNPFHWIGWKIDV